MRFKFPGGKTQTQREAEAEAEADPSLPPSLPSSSADINRIDNRYGIYIHIHQVHQVHQVG